MDTIALDPSAGYTTMWTNILELCWLRGTWRASEQALWTLRHRQPGGIDASSLRSASTPPALM